MSASGTSWPLVRGTTLSAATLWMATYASYIGLVFYERTWLFNAVRVSVIWLLLAVVLFVAAIYLRRSMSSLHPTGMRMVWMAMSFTSYFITLYAALVLITALATGLNGYPNLQEVIFESLSLAKAIDSSLAFTLGGLGMVALGLVQRRAGKLLQVASIANVSMGVITLALWIEIFARFMGMSNYDALLGNSEPLSWLIGSIVSL